MTFLMSEIWGVKVWILFYLALSFMGFIAILVWFYKEKIKKKYYEVRFPEKLLRVVLHYKSNMYKEFWRLIPDLEYFVIEGKQYQFDSKSILKENDFFVKGKPPEQTVSINGLKYRFNNLFLLKNRWNKYAEIHYFYNSPIPLNFDISQKKVDFSSKQLQEFKENDLFRKLLTLDQEKNMLMFLLMITIATLIGTVFIIAKLMGWIE